MTAPGGGNDTRTATVDLNANVSGYSQQMDMAAASTNNAASAVDRLDAKLDGLAKRAGRKLINFSAADFAVMAGATATAATLDKQLGTLAATAAITGTSFAGIKAGVESAFTKFPNARSEIVALTSAVSDLGVTAPRDIGSLVQTFIKLGAATGEGTGQLASGLTQLSRLMGNNDVQQIGNYANSLLTVSKFAGVSATGVLNFAQTIAPMARQAGIGEAAVLGISAAFSKAGADGFVASNVFNSMIGDITNLIATGSPDLAKYSNLIGVTVAQFKKMDKTSAFTQLFDAIAKQGPAAVNTLNRLGQEGVRSQSAIAAVVQSGGLSSQIATATGSSNNQANLTKGSAAAMNNLADGLSRLRNQFVQFGTMIGETFITPMGKFVNSLDWALGALNNFIKPLTPIIAVLAGLAGAMSAVGGAALSMAGLIGTIGLAKLAVSSGPVRALREGLMVGRGGSGGASSAMYEQHLIAQQYGNGYGASMPLRAKLPFLIGSGGGQLLPSVGGPSMPGGDPNAFAQAQRYALRSPLMAATAFTRSSTRLSADEAVNDYNRSFYKGGNPSFKASMSDSLERNKLNTAEMTSTQAVIAGLKEFAVALLQAGAQVTRTGMAVMRPSNWSQGGFSGGTWSSRGFVDQQGNQVPHAMGTAPRFGAIRGAAGAIAGAGRGLSGAAMGLFGGPLGLGLMAGVGGVEAYQALSAKQKKQDQVVNDSINPLVKLNDQVGVTTTTMATFNNSVATAAKNLASQIPGGTTLGQATSVSSQDISAFKTQKPTDKTIAAMAAHGAKKGPEAQKQITALAQSYNMSDPRSIAAFKANLISAGYSATDIEAGLKPLVGANGTVLGGTPDYANLAKQVIGTEGKSPGYENLLGIHNQSTTGGQLTASALSSVDIQRKTDLTTHALGYANARSLQGATTFLGGLAGGAGKSPETSSALADALATLTGGKKDEFTKNFVNGTYKGGSGQQDILKLLSGTKSGKNYLESVRQDTGLTMEQLTSLSPSALQQLITSQGNKPGNITDYQSTVGGVGGPHGQGVGQFALKNAAIGSAIANPADANAQQAAMQALYDQVKNAGGSFQDISQVMDNFKGAIKDSSDPLYKLADAAKAFGAQMQQVAMQGMSREGQLGQLAANQQQAQVSFNNPDASPTAGVDLQNAKLAYQQGLQQYAQYEQSMQNAAVQFGIQMARAQEDQDTSIKRSKLSFQINEQHSQEDFNRQNLLSMRDFGIQMARQAQSEAESIYDPFHRVQAQTTVSASTLVQNLQDQNKKIADQYTNLQKLAAAGVSQSAIDTLQLANPNNAQQLASIVNGLMSDPSLVNQINQVVGTRVAATAQLTQSTFSETFRNTTSDFTRQLSDTADAYNIQKQRAIDSQALSLSQMAEDFNKMSIRSAQDLAQSFTQIYGDYATSYGNAVAAINSDIGKYSPQIAAQLTAELTEMYTKVAAFQAVVAQTEFVNPTTGKPEPASQVVGHASGGVSTFAHRANISEGNKTEMIIPLDQRGLGFMTGFANQVSMAMLRQMGTAAYPSRPTGAAPNASVSHTQDNSINVDTVNVQANDVRQLQAELEKRRRIKALSMPPASTAGSLG